MGFCIFVVGVVFIGGVVFGYVFGVCCFLVVVMLIVGGIVIILVCWLGWVVVVLNFCIFVFMYFLFFGVFLRVCLVGGFIDFVWSIGWVFCVLDFGSLFGIFGDLFGG